MKYIGITGEKHSGKSTLAVGIQEAMPGTPHIEISDIVTKVANDFRKRYVPSKGDTLYRVNCWLEELPEVLNTNMGLETSSSDLTFTNSDLRDRPNDYRALLSYAQKINDNPTFQHEVINHRNKESHREILQALGSAVVAIRPTAWFEEAFRQIERARTSLTTLGVVSTVAFKSDEEYVRSHGGIITRVERPDQSEEATQLDPTDRERSLIVADITAHNDGSYDQAIAAGKRVVSLVQRKEYPNTIVCSEQ
jgi:hypothetical protein